MFSPLGFVSVKEIEDKTRDLAGSGFTSADFHGLLKQAPEVFVTDNRGSIMRIAPGLLAVGKDGEYLFISRSKWMVDLDWLRNSPLPNSGLRVGLYFLTDTSEVSVVRDFGRDGGLI